MQSSVIYVKTQQYASAMPAKPTFAWIALLDIAMSSNHCLMTLYHSKDKSNSYCNRNASINPVKDFRYTVNNGVRCDKTDELEENMVKNKVKENTVNPVSYTHLRAHETSLHLVCRLLLEKIM